jgi:hypothetical protein
VAGQAGDADVEEAAEGEADETDEDGDERDREASPLVHDSIRGAVGIIVVK